MQESLLIFTQISPYKEHIELIENNMGAPCLSEPLVDLKKRLVFAYSSRSSNVGHSISSDELNNIVKISMEIVFQIENDDPIIDEVMNGENGKIGIS